MPGERFRLQIGFQDWDQNPMNPRGGSVDCNNW